MYYGLQTKEYLKEVLNRTAIEKLFTINTIPQ